VRYFTFSTLGEQTKHPGTDANLHGVVFKFSDVIQSIHRVLSSNLASISGDFNNDLYYYTQP
jgi:hypothetical protein